MLRLDINGYTEQEALLLILSGLQAKAAALAQKISEVRAFLNGTQKAASAPVKPTPSRKAVAAKKPAATKKPKPAKTSGPSAEGRARIAAAQKKRWAKMRREKAAKPTPRAKLNLAPAEPAELPLAVGE